MGQEKKYRPFENEEEARFMFFKNIYQFQVLNKYFGEIVGIERNENNELVFLVYREKDTHTTLTTGSEWISAKRLFREFRYYKVGSGLIPAGIEI